MQHRNERPHSFTNNSLRKATTVTSASPSSSILSSESNKTNLSRSQKKDLYYQQQHSQQHQHYRSLSSTYTSGSDEMEIERDSYYNDKLDSSSAQSIRSGENNHHYWTNNTHDTTPTRTLSKAISRRQLLHKKTSNSSFSTFSSTSAGSPKPKPSSSTFNRTPLKSLTNFPSNVKEKTKAFTKSMSEVVHKSSQNFLANLHMTPKLTECTSTYDDIEDEEVDGIVTDCDSENENKDEILQEEEQQEELEESDDDDEGETTFDTINIESPIMHRKSNSIQINQQRQQQQQQEMGNYENEPDYMLTSPTRSMSRPPITNRPKTIRRIHSVCETQREIDDFQLHEDNSQLRYTNIQTFPSKNDMLPRINEDQLYKILCGEHKHDFDEYVIVDCRFDYEYHGGHIINAMNIPTKEALEDVFIKQGGGNQNDPSLTRNNKSKKKLLIFHCEFSIFRGPTMAKHLRKCDRMLNQNSYPYLYWPDVVILEGGYKNFFTKYKSFCYPQNYVEMKDIKHEVSCEANLSRVRKDNKLLTRAKSFNQFGGGRSDRDHDRDRDRDRASGLTSVSTSDFSSLSLLSHNRSSSSHSFSNFNSGKVIKRQRSNTKVRSISSNLNTKLTRANTTNFDQPNHLLHGQHNNHYYHHPSSSLSMASLSTPLSSPLFNNFDFNEEIEKDNPERLQQQQEHEQQQPLQSHPHSQPNHHHHSSLHSHSQHSHSYSQQQQQQQHQLRSFLPPSTSFRNPHHHKAQSSSSSVSSLLSSSSSSRHRRSYSTNLSSISNYSSSSISIHSSASSIASEGISSSTDSLNDAYSGLGSASEVLSPPALAGGTGGTGTGTGTGTGSSSSLSMAQDYFQSKRLSSTSTSSLPTVPPSMLRPVSRKPSSLQTSLAALVPAPPASAAAPVPSHARVRGDTSPSLSPSRSPFIQPNSSFQFPPQPPLQQRKSISTTNVPIVSSPKMSSPLQSRMYSSTSRSTSRSRSRSRSRTREGHGPSGSISSIGYNNAHQSPSWLSNTSGTIVSKSSNNTLPSRIDYEEEEGEGEEGDTIIDDDEADPINDTPVDFNVLDHNGDDDPYRALPQQQHQLGGGPKKHHYHQLASATASATAVPSRAGLSTWPGDNDQDTNGVVAYTRSHGSSNNSNDTIVLGGAGGVGGALGYSDPTTGFGAYSSTVYSVDDINEEDDEEDL